MKNKIVMITAMLAVIMTMTGIAAAAGITAPTATKINFGGQATIPLIKILNGGLLNRMDLIHFPKYREMITIQTS